MFWIKDILPQYIILDEANKHAYVIPRATEDVKETQWGWHNNVLARFLCPQALAVEFDQDPEYFYTTNVIICDG